MIKSYIYSDSGQILAQRDGGQTANKYFYVTDRLGSIRLVVDSAGTVKNTYTYNPYGEMFATECTENTENNFKFTGQWLDSEFGQYYLRARMYDPALMRLTTGDPVRGKFRKPMSLHPYLYCWNDPINRTDPKGEISAALIVVGGIVGGLSAAINSGCDEWSDASAIAAGVGLGMFAGMLPNTAMGYLTGMILSATNTTYSTWIGGGDMSKLGTKLFFGAAGGGIGGPIGALSDKLGVWGYIGSEIFGGAFSYGAEEVYEAVERSVEDYMEYLKSNE